MTDEATSPLRQRMIEDMTIRKLAPKTQHDYVQRVKNFAAFLGRSPDTASFEDVRRYQLHLATSGAGVPTLNQSVSTLRFFFRVTLGRADILNHTQFVHEPRKLPVVLSPELCSPIGVGTPRRLTACRFHPRPARPSPWRGTSPGRIGRLENRAPRARARCRGTGREC